MLQQVNLVNQPPEVQSAIRGLKFGKAPGPNGIPNSALKHRPLTVVSVLVVYAVRPGGLETCSRVHDP
jgi:hypothetical protein